MRMVALQLLVALVVLLTSDGAKSNEKQPKEACDISALFCLYVSMAFYNNERAVGDLMDQKVGRYRFTEDSQRLRDTSRAIGELLKLKAENKSELVEASRTPLYMEVRSLFHLRVTCSDGRRPLIVCNETLDSVLLATLDLIKAVEEVAEGNQLKKIKEAHRNFQPDYLKPPENQTVFEVVNVFGNAVSSILDT